MIRAHYDADGDRTCGEGGCRQKLGRCSLHRKRGASALNNAMARLGTVDFVREGYSPTAAYSDGSCRTCGYYVCNCPPKARLTAALKRSHDDYFGVDLYVPPKPQRLRGLGTWLPDAPFPPFTVGDRVALRHGVVAEHADLTVIERNARGNMKLQANRTGRVLGDVWRDEELKEYKGP